MGSHLSVPELSVHSQDVENGEYAVSLQAIQGYRAEMEDAHTLLLDIPRLPGWSFFGVFDGHAGDLCSKTVAEQLPKVMFDDAAFVEAALSADAAEPENSYSLKVKSGGPAPSSSSQQQSAAGAVQSVNEHENSERSAESSAATNSKDIKQCITKAFVEFDRRFRQQHPMDKSGTTGTCVLISPKSYYFINIGDSRTILVGAANESNLQFETRDHKPSDADERRRILDSGCDVAHGRINSLLAVSRAFGDFDYKLESHQPEEQTVCVIPDITVVPRDVQHTGIICACDGIWDIYNSDQVSLYSRFFWRASSSAHEIARRLVHSSLERGSKDNMSVIAIQFKHRECDLYSAQSDEAQYLEALKQHIRQQSKHFMKHSVAVPKHDSMDKQKFITKEAIKINNQFMRQYTYANSYGHAQQHGQMELVTESGNTASEEQKLETYADFIARNELYMRHKSNPANYFTQLGPCLFFEDVQSIAEGCIESALTQEMGVKEGPSAIAG